MKHRRVSFEYQVDKPVKAEMIKSKKSNNSGEEKQNSGSEDDYSS